MATVFKYKTPVNRNYAPGFVKPGLDGYVGNKGRSGNAVYFVDFDLDNSYDIEMALQKIENNFIHIIYKINEKKELIIEYEVLS